MTTLVGIQGRNWALLGADTRIADDSTIYRLAKGHSKIIEHETFTIAGKRKVIGAVFVIRD